MSRPQPTATLIRRFNIVGTFFWAGMMPVALRTGWVHSLTFLGVVSIYALAAAHLAAWRSDANPPQSEGTDA